MEKNIEFKGGGLVCDNPNCDYKNENVLFEDYSEWLDKPCPKCGENLLTQEDYENARLLHLSIDIVNSLSEEELEFFNKAFQEKGFPDLPIFEDVQDLKFNSTNGNVLVEVGTHKEIKIKSIKKID